MCGIVAGVSGRDIVPVLVQGLQRHARVVAFDMPGFGFSVPSATYNHTLDAGAQAVLQVMDALQVGQVTNSIILQPVAQLISSDRGENGHGRVGRRAMARSAALQKGSARQKE